jgi:3-oxoacyl-[acyl-carrier-protein] synthase-3
VSAYLPATSVPVSAVCDRLGLPPSRGRLFERHYGLDHVRLDPDATGTDLLLSAVAKLDALRGREHLVRYVLHARTLTFVAPYSSRPVQDVCHVLGLHQAYAFAVTQHACASGLLAVDLAGRLLAAGRAGIGWSHDGGSRGKDGGPQALALVLTGEKAFTPIAQVIPDTTVMGEGAAACLVGLDGHRDRVLAFATCTKGEYRAGLAMPEEMAVRFQQEYVSTLAEIVESAVAQAGLALADVALILPHNVNRISWVRLCRRLGYPIERVFLENVPVTGHCFCADPFLNLHAAAERGLLEPGQVYVMTAVGLGATFSAMVVRH